MSDIAETERAIEWEALVRRRPVLSPPRHPGGKRRLFAYLAAAPELNGLKADLFVEPFAGGASVALELAHAGAVKRIGLADSDPWVASFWKTVSPTRFGAQYRDAHVRVHAGKSLTAPALGCRIGAGDSFSHSLPRSG